MGIIESLQQGQCRSRRALRRIINDLENVFELECLALFRPSLLEHRQRVHLVGVITDLMRSVQSSRPVIESGLRKGGQPNKVCVRNGRSAVMQGGSCSNRQHQILKVPGKPPERFGIDNGPERAQRLRPILIRNQLFGLSKLLSGERLIRGLSHRGRRMIDGLREWPPTHPATPSIASSTRIR